VKVASTVVVTRREMREMILADGEMRREWGREMREREDFAEIGRPAKWETSLGF
jgi:hypothetical protein